MKRRFPSIRAWSALAGSVDFSDLKAGPELQDGRLDVRATPKAVMEAR